MADLDREFALTTDGVTPSVVNANSRSRSAIELALPDRGFQAVELTRSDRHLN